MIYPSTALLEQALNPNVYQFGPKRLDLLAEYAKKLDCFHWDIPIVTITGTNGKGSTVAALKSIYQAAGFRAGVYTSPHLLSYHERICINDKPISEDDFVCAIQAIDLIIDKNAPISFFERLTLIALYYFKQQAPDVLILEVGLGGRLDAVNVLDADLVIVTTVDFDHQDYLGHTIDEIAFEKAGLFRSGQKAIFADMDCPSSMQKHAYQLGTQLFHYRKDYDYLETEQQTLKIRCHESEMMLTGKPKVRTQAFVSAVYASFLLRDRLFVSQNDWQQALKHSFLAGRMQVVLAPTRIVLDVSHNPQGVRYLTHELKKMASDVQIHAVFSMMRDKNIVECVQEFNKLSPIWYNTVLSGDRASTEASIDGVFKECGLAYQFFPNPNQAFQAARKAAALNDVIVVFGSFLMIEPIMRLLMEEGYNVFTAQ